MPYEEQVALKDKNMRHNTLKMTRKIRKEMVKLLRAKSGLDNKPKGKGKGGLPPVCFSFSKTGSCQFLDACRYRHLTPEQEAEAAEESSGNQQVQLPSWLNNCQPDGMFCEYVPLTPSPQVDGYRNKCEFTVGPDSAGKPSCGFRVGSYVDGSVSVDSPRDCPNVSPIAKESCQLFVDFIQSSPLPPYDKFRHTGCWRQLTVRNTTYTNELMWMVQVARKDVSTEGWAKEQERLISFLSKLSVPVTSLAIQTYEGLSQPQSSDGIENIVGTPYINEMLLGKKFRISPDAFFQVNTKGAEALYSLIKECVVAPGLSDKTEDSVLLDVCCGTGTIGICMSDAVKQVIGVEMCEPAVRDARFNATANKVENTLFYASKAEKIMQNLLTPSDVVEEIGGEKMWHLPSDTPCIAVVDPPRAGLHPDVIRSIRNCAVIKRVVYVSCNPVDSLPNDVAQFVKEQDKRLKGKPFRPVRAIPVDMFPHTNHCEMIMVLERD
jgi:tRNA (uracil-5-)-methyltransferase